jgi:hypothetical protein
MPAIDIKTALFQAASEAFKDGEVSVKILTPDSPKLARRNFVDNQVSVRVQFSTPNGSFAIAGFIPEDAKPGELEKLITRLRLDRRNSEAALKPAAVV